MKKCAPDKKPRGFGPPTDPTTKRYSNNKEDVKGIPDASPFNAANCQRE